MTKQIGFSRPIKLAWLDKTVELVSRNLSDEEIRNELREYLSYEITSKVNIRKTVTILTNIWVNKPKSLEFMKKLGIETYSISRTTSNQLVSHWCMMLLTYPLFYDTCNIIGNISNIQDTFTIKWLKNKLYELWGETTTLKYSVDRIIQTLKDMGSIENVDIGVYKINSYEIIDYQTILLIVLTTLYLRESAYLSLTELTYVPFMFPFKYQISLDVLIKYSNIIKLDNFGGQIVASYNQ